MSVSLRIAILVDPLSVRVKGSDHAPALARELLARGHTVRGFGAPADYIPRSGADPGQGTGPGSDEGMGVVAFRPDVVVAYDALSPAAWRGARVCRTLDVPLVLVEAGTAQGGSFFERFLWSLGGRLFGRLVRRATSAVVALDPVARAQALKEGFSSARIQVLPMGVDLNLFRPGISSALVSRHRIHGRVLLNVGPLEAYSGARTLVRAFGRTVGQRGDWALVFAGEGSQRDALRALAGRLGVSARVHFLPKPRPEELPGLFGSCTLFAAPALDERVRGVQVIRAMGCGRGVLLSDVDRLRPLVEPEESGLVAPPGDVAAWTRMLQRAASAPEARRRWGARSREIAEQRYSWPVVAEAFEALVLRAREATLRESPAAQRAALP